MNFDFFWQAWGAILAGELLGRSAAMTLGYVGLMGLTKIVQLLAGRLITAAIALKLRPAFIVTFVYLYFKGLISPFRSYLAATEKPGKVTLRESRLFLKEFSKHVHDQSARYALQN